LQHGPSPGDVSPFARRFVIARGGVASARCADCVSGVQLLDFTQNRGIAFAFTVHEP
jgi:hypothetical protein